MSEFKEKVEELKQTFSEPGFTVGEDPQETPDVSQENSLTPSKEEQVLKKKPKRSHKQVEAFRSRIDQLTFENNVREAQNQELLAKLQEQERLLSEKHYQLEQNEQHKNAYYENNLVTRENSILSELKVAKEEGDVDKEIALSKELAKVEAEKSTYGLYKSQLRNQPSAPSVEDTYEAPENKYYPTPSLPQEHQEPENEVYEDWLEKNQWADPGSSHFSPRLRQEIDQVDAELSDLLRYNGESHLIGTLPYFESLDRIMKERYGVKGDSSEPPQDSHERSSPAAPYSVAPVSRNGASMADQYIASNPNNTRHSTSLSEDEYKIARNLQIKLPNGRYVTGNEAVKRYAEAKRKFPRDPHRPFSLTID